MFTFDCCAQHSIEALSGYTPHSQGGGVICNFDDYLFSDKTIKKSVLDSNWNIGIRSESPVERNYINDQVLPGEG